VVSLLISTLRLISAFCLLPFALAAVAVQSPRYDIYAVRFAHVPYGLSSLVAGAERGPQVDIAFTVWPLRDTSSGRVILVDAGFYRDKFIQSWKPQGLRAAERGAGEGAGHRA
jgi:hypothetical protein